MVKQFLSLSLREKTLRLLHVCQAHLFNVTRFRFSLFLLHSLFSLFDHCIQRRMWVCTLTRHTKEEETRTIYWCRNFSKNICRPNFAARSKKEFPSFLSLSFSYSCSSFDWGWGPRILQKVLFFDEPTTIFFWRASHTVNLRNRTHCCRLSSAQRVTRKELTKNRELLWTTKSWADH